MIRKQPQLTIGHTEKQIRFVKIKMKIWLPAPGLLDEHKENGGETIYDSAL